MEPIDRDPNQAYLDSLEDAFRDALATRRPTSPIDDLIARAEADEIDFDARAQRVLAAWIDDAIAMQDVQTAAFLREQLRRGRWWFRVGRSTAGRAADVRYGDHNVHDEHLTGEELERMVQVVVDGPDADQPLVLLAFDIERLIADALDA